MATTSTLLLKKLPKEAKQYIILLQAKMKLEKNSGTYSQEATVIKIIKEHKEFCDKIIKPG